MNFYFSLQISGPVEVVTCELGALTTWGDIPDVVTEPVGGKFLLVTEAHEKVYEGCSKVLLRLLLYMQSTSYCMSTILIKLFDGYDEVLQTVH